MDLPLHEILEPDGNIKFIALLRIWEMSPFQQSNVINSMILTGIVDSEEDLWKQLFDKIAESKGHFGVCEPKPMSDDVLDAGVQYLDMNQYLLDINDDEQE